MAKVFGILLIVLGVWLGIEVMTKGTDGAFGGIFAQGGASVPSESGQPIGQKARTRVQESMKATAERTAQGIGDEPDDADMIDPSEVDADSLEH